MKGLGDYDKMSHRYPSGVNTDNLSIISFGSSTFKDSLNEKRKVLLMFNKNEIDNWPICINKRCSIIKKKLM